MAFIKSRARIYEPGKDPVTFADVAGSQEEKEDLAEVVDFLKNPKSFEILVQKSQERYSWFDLRVLVKPCLLERLQGNLMYLFSQ